MSKEQVNDRIAESVRFAFWAYAVLMIFVAAVILTFFPLWALCFMLPIIAVTYDPIKTGLSVYFFAKKYPETVNEIVAQPVKMTVEEFKARYIEVNGDGGGYSDEFFQRMIDTNNTVIVQKAEVSEEIVGYFNDEVMYEWVQFFDPRTGQLEYFYYDGPAEFKDGAVVIPDDKQKFYLALGSVLYYREVEPQSEVTEEVE